MTTHDTLAQLAANPYAYAFAFGFLSGAMTMRRLTRWALGGRL